MAWTDTQISEYNAYLEFLRTSEGADFPIPTDITDYFTHRDEWMEEWGGTPEGEFPEYEWTTPQRAAYERYQMYADLYGDPDDWKPENIQGFFDNYDVANGQLDEWTTEASRDYQQYRDLASHREPGDWYTTNLDEFVANYEQAQTQQDIWLGRYTEQETGQRGLDEYYDWQRQRARESAEEAYRPEVQYGAAFYKKQEALKGESVYYQNWMRSMFPELQRRFEATQPRPVGYPTREEARAAAGETEQTWGQYLYGQTPKLRQEFYGQRPSERGERPWAYAQRLREVSYR